MKVLHVSGVVALLLAVGVASSASAAGPLLTSVDFGLDKDSYVAGDIVRATATYRNDSSGPIAINEALVTARRPGTTHTSGPFHNFDPAQPAQTVPAGGSFTIESTYRLPAGGPAGRWEVYPTYRDADGWHDGPSKFIGVSVPSPPLSPLNSTGFQVDRSTYAPGDAIRATALYHNPNGAPFSIREAVVTARRPGATHTSGPFDNFEPAQPAQTIPGDGTLRIDSAFTLPADSPSGTWEVYPTYHDADGWHDGPSVLITVAAPPTAPPDVPTRQPPPAPAPVSTVSGTSAPTPTRAGAVTVAAPEITRIGTVLIPFSQRYDVGRLRAARVCPGVGVTLTLKLKKRVLDRRRTTFDRRCRFRVTFRVPLSRLGNATRLTATARTKPTRYLLATTNQWTLRVRMS